MLAVKSFIEAYVVVLTILLRFVPSCEGGRFVSSGPVLTVTLKDSHEKLTDVTDSADGTMVPTSQQQQQQWFNLGNFRPSLIWSLHSQGKPLPNWLPNWQSLRTTVGYQYESLKRMPSFVEADLKFSSNTLGVDLEVQPSYDFGLETSLLSVQASRGAGAYLMAKFATKKERWLQLVRGCYQVELPYASVGAFRVTPTWDLAHGQASCRLEGTTGSQRTKAVLNLEYDNPTLTVIHSLDERNTIAPEISLYNARILYQWNIALDNGSIRTKVDPTTAIHVTWTDRSPTGKWVTDFHLPLAGTTISALAADVKVRRQFSF